MRRKTVSAVSFFSSSSSNLYDVIRLESSATFLEPVCAGTATVPAEVSESEAVFVGKLESFGNSSIKILLRA